MVLHYDYQREDMVQRCGTMLDNLVYCSGSCNMKGDKNHDLFIRSYLAIDSMSPTGLVWTGNPNKSQCSKLKNHPAGTLNKGGYYQVRVDGKIIYNHRAIFFLFHGKWPDGQVDHIDGVRTNNLIDNLRDVTRSENNQNMVVKGCYWCKRDKKWHARIRVNGNVISLGYFRNEAEARSAYLSAKQKIHPTAPERCYE